MVYPLSDSLAQPFSFGLIACPLLVCTLLVLAFIMEVPQDFLMSPVPNVCGYTEVRNVHAHALLMI
jgi:uncharacterized membrane protein